MGRQLRSVLGIVMVPFVMACDDGAVRADRWATTADLVHVHGLADSEEGLYVATHTGLFEVVPAGIRPVTDAMHDLMGFTVAGPDDLLASGHPDLRVESLQVDGKPPLLGLVHSSDGHTWEPLSLLGEADFHTLAAVHGRVYGFDGTTGGFMVSDDRTTWDVRSVDLRILDFAVSPEDPDVIVATGESGVVGSTDGGRSWGHVNDAPVTFLSWPADDLYGVASDGQLVASTDRGATWEKLGRLQGRPEALHVNDDVVYAAVADSGILRSTDGGQTFHFLVDTADDDQ